MNYKAARIILEREVGKYDSEYEVDELIDLSNNVIVRIRFRGKGGNYKYIAYKGQTDYEVEEYGVEEYRLLIEKTLKDSFE